MPSQILEALYKGDEAEARRLADGARLNVFEAAALGHDDRVRELIGADPMQIRALGEDGFSALHLAAYFSEQLACVRLLIEHGADVNVHSANDFEVTPLGSAAARNHGIAAGVLVEAGARPEEAQRGGVTPLHSAARNGNDVLADLLLRNGARAGRKSDEGKTAADYAAEAGHDELAERLREAAVAEEDGG